MSTGEQQEVADEEDSRWPLMSVQISEQLAAAEQFKASKRLTHIDENPGAQHYLWKMWDVPLQNYREEHPPKLFRA